MTYTFPEFACPYPDGPILVNLKHVDVESLMDFRPGAVIRCDNPVDIIPIRRQYGNDNMEYIAGLISEDV